MGVVASALESLLKIVGVVLILAVLVVLALLAKFYFETKGKEEEDDEEPGTGAPSLEANRLCPCTFRISPTSSQARIERL